MIKKPKHKSSVHQPHDKIVKKILSHPETARDILTLYLPQEILSIIDLNHLKLQKDSFIDDEHRANATDLLFKTSCKNKDGYIWILLEHQRKSDYWMPLRLFKYMGLIWDHVRKSSQSKYLPFIYPLVIYNGDTPYTHSRSLVDLIEPEDSKILFSKVFLEPFALIDLPAIEDEALKKRAQEHLRGMALLVSLKYITHRHLQMIYDQILHEMLININQSGDTDSVSDLLYYLFKEGKYLNIERFLESFHNNFSVEVEDNMATIAQQIELRGMEKGREEGIETGMQKGIEITKLELAKKLLSEEIGLSESDLIAFVERLTGFSKDKLKSLCKNAEEKLILA